MGDGFSAEGTMLLSFAKVGATLECYDATFRAEGRVCLKAYELSTGGSILLGPRFESEGMVTFGGARIGGQLIISKSRLRASGGPALEAKRAIVSHGFIIQQETTIDGEVNITGAEIEGGFECRGVSIRNPGGCAIAADRVTAKTGVSFKENFTCKGTIRLGGASVGAFDCAGLTFEGRAADALSLRAPGLNVGGSFRWRGADKGSLEGVDLTGAHVGQLDDDLGSWPDGRRISVDNFTYDSFGRPMLGLEERLAWLRRQKDFSLQPYEQAAGVLRRMGYEKEARRIAQTKHDDLREFGSLSRLAWVRNRFLGLTLGHGYQLWRVLVFAAVIVAAGTLFFEYAFRQGVMQPVKDRPKESYQVGQQCPENVLCFEPLVYSVDVFLPIVDLREEQYWLPVGTGTGAAVFRGYYWFHILMGWLLTTLGVAGLTGLVKKD